MKNKIKYLSLILLSAVFLYSFSGIFLFGKGAEYSDSERRKLNPLPSFSAESIINGKYMKDFEEAAPDQFPMREAFRTIKAYAAKYLFRVKDNNDVYEAEGYLSKLEYPQKNNMLDHAAEKFSYIYENYLKDTSAKLYFSVVPDKNCFLAENNGYLSLDYNALISYMRDKTPYLDYIDIMPLLSLEDYYYTDTHWRQEKIKDVASHLMAEMNADFQDNFTENRLDIPFKGVFLGQSALLMPPDEIVYLTSEETEYSVVQSHETGMPKQNYMYNFKKAAGKDAYELFLSGTEALLTIENPLAAEKKELILFRDSFGSSVAPLMVQGYSKITLIDIRYISSTMLDKFVNFSEADDVLFLYSTVLLNNSLAMK